MYEVMMYDGGVYRSNELLEMIEDIGGVVLQKTRSAQMLTVTMSIPGEDKEEVEKVCTAIGGMVKSVPLAGTEIAVVGPTLGRHHMPHPICDIAEVLRQLGAITVVMGLARGRGKATSQISMQEMDIINEYDAAVFVLGNFKSCVEAKSHLFEKIKVPVILVSGPMPDNLEETCDAIVSGVGRKSERMRTPEERKKLDEISDRTDEVLRIKRKMLEEDPLFVHPAEIKQLLEEYEPIKESLRPAPIVLHLDGLRLKVPMKDNVKNISDMIVYGRRLGDITKISESRIDGSSMIVRIMTSSEVRDRDRDAQGHVPPVP
ncbi:MAG: methanogenesis marker 7 protein [Methanomassiliicoccaceae archaeon]|jgi:putative methanogenesis marker protein 7|nr:methanogenesis marker 7 protein [Methanomassiliicoccaceae archaeon]